MTTAAIAERDVWAGTPPYGEYPRLRFMGSKHRLLPWIESVLADLEFDTAIDAFSGSGCVSYLLKSMGKSVRSNDFLRFASDFTHATVENSHEILEAADVDLLLSPVAEKQRRRFIEETFHDIFFADEDNAFLDQVWAHLPILTPYKRSLALASLYRACLKRQPRGVFTVSGIGRYDDGRRDLRMSLKEHFVESVPLFNKLVFDNGRTSYSVCGDVFSLRDVDADLVYLDPPYVPRADDNCYIKRYHFLEGLSSYWRDAEFHPTSKVKKLRKRYTPFSYRREAEAAFDRLFQLFKRSTIVLSYSSNGYPDLDRLVSLVGRYKADVTVNSEEHRYHFGTHGAVAAERALVTEYLIVGR
ncbi:DNA adenine methylase [Gaiella sp.]|uniref:DNA adenine methylase n=1 Tax=Gaiella sp. TaxID=2663207 RepID=UPI002E3739EC|nr:DNA adenine methylase [Gaiella sp.]HEX5582406.1 DNA adenine methylase [Gaiella sp.]